MALLSVCRVPDAGSGALPSIPAGILERFDPVVLDVPVGAHLFRVLTVRNPDLLLESITPEAFAVDERLPYWAELWTSSLVLARVCLEEETLAGRTVLEIGCGVGLAGIAAARAGAQVTLSDYEPDALAFASWNAAANLTAEERARVNLCLCDWRAPGIPGTYERILGGDVIYERRAFAPILEMIRRTLAPGGYAILAEPDRTLGKEFLALAATEGFRVTTRPAITQRRGRTTNVTVATIHPPIPA